MEAIKMVLEIFTQKALEGRKENNIDKAFYYANAASILQEGINGNIEVLGQFLKEEN